MKIGYDAKRVFFNNTGLGNYSRWLIKTVAYFHTENSCILYTPKAKTNPRLGFLAHFTNIHTVTPASKLFISWWRSKGIVNDLKRDSIELYHGLSHELPAGIRQSGIPSVVTVHDLIFMRFPKQFGWFNCYIYRAKLKHACRVADKIIAISQKTKDDLIELLQIEPDKIAVIYQGCDVAFDVAQTAAQKAAVKLKYNLPDKYLLSVGTIEERKNLLLIAKALQDIDNSLPLVVVGKTTKYIDEVTAYLAANNLTHRVTFLNNVRFDDLPAIYQLASVFIYPSRYEGFGIPILEALNSGVPVIAATGSCLEEAGGPGSRYVDPDDAVGLAKEVNQILGDDILRQTMINRGIEHAANFNDDKLALQLQQLYTNILNNA
ncbi:glycosyltransferase family 4 protein [Mucilaginibacter ginsenosidivorax]|uniref:Glycosyltransferase family 4 protein n=1 Tax=Mucilaginibacter ginsenosidivorax TaxID=862126 RepID=A0A5B8W2P9_9SPHI|nr:glycosyltransferase family 1 protein [Mucilaginibacter ginsenosidivorax]QEC78124.1 glycosyltransferase family 4 protein [Mucilaginibacter ginsenosidivorax]